MKNFLTTMALVLALGMFAHAQHFDMQRSLNINGESNPIRPEITNEFSYLGAAYTIGEKAGNLTGNYGDYVQVRCFPQYNPADIGITMAFYDMDGKQKSVEAISLDFGMSGTGGVTLGLRLVIVANKALYTVSGTVIGPEMDDSSLFDKLGGYVDYVAISGAGGNVTITNFQFGNGWFDPVNRIYDFTNMATMRGYALDAGFTGEPSFSNGNFTFGSGNNNSVTFTSKAVAWNAETGIGIKGSLATGGSFGLLGWNHLTFTFGSFERVPAAPVPEPGTLLVLGLAAAGLPVVRRFRRG